MDIQRLELRSKGCWGGVEDVQCQMVNGRRNESREEHPATLDGRHDLALTFNMHRREHEAMAMEEFVSRTRRQASLKRNSPR
jgi:hypothetical protein